MWLARKICGDYQADLTALCQNSPSPEPRPGAHIHHYEQDAAAVTCAVYMRTGGGLRARADLGIVDAQRSETCAKIRGYATPCTVAQRVDFSNSGRGIRWCSLRIRILSIFIGKIAGQEGVDRRHRGCTNIAGMMPYPS